MAFTPATGGALVQIALHSSPDEHKTGAAIRALHLWCEQVKPHGRIWHSLHFRRLLLNAVVCSRVSELRETPSAGTIALEISSRNARIQALQERWSTLRAAIAQLLTERAADMAEVPGGGTGLLVRQYQGGAPIYKVDTGLVSLIGQLLAQEKQAAEDWASGPRR